MAEFKVNITLAHDINKQLFQGCFIISRESSSGAYKRKWRLWGFALIRVL